VQAVLEKVRVKGITHITGGGFYENFPRVTPDGMGVQLNASAWEVPEIFDFLKDHGEMSLEEMYGVFNMGVGMALIVRKEMVEEARARVAVFASGSGTNFEAMMHHANRDFDVVTLVCDVPKAHVIGKAAAQGVETVVLDPATFPSKADYEQEIIAKLKRANVEWII